MGVAFHTTTTTTHGRPPRPQPAPDGGPPPPDVTGDKAYNEAKEKFAKLLNLHLLPRDSPPPPQAPQQPADTDDTPDPTAASSSRDTDAADLCTAGPEDDEGEGYTAEELAIQAEWAAGQDGCFQMHEDDIPPEVPLSSNSHADITQLPLGCWRVTIAADTGVYIQRVAGKPRTVLLNDAGPVLTAPPLPIDWPSGSPRPHDIGALDAQSRTSAVTQPI